MIFCLGGIITTKRQKRGKEATFPDELGEKKIFKKKEKKKASVRTTVRSRLRRTMEASEQRRSVQSESGGDA